MRGKLSQRCKVYNNWIMKLLPLFKNVPRNWMFFLWTGMVLCVLSVAVFAVTAYFFSYDTSYQQYSHPLLLLVLLCLLFVGYTGPIFLFIGIFLWSLTGGKLRRAIVWIFLVALLFLFVPLPITCASIPVICADIVFPFELEYWRLVHDHFIHGDAWNVHWHYFGRLYLEEGFGDVAKEILNVQDSI